MRMDWNLILHETILYTFAFLIARLIGYPLVNVTGILRREAAEKKDKKSDIVPDFSFSLKTRYINDIIQKSNSNHGLFHGWEYYVVPSVSAAFGEGLGFFPAQIYLKDHSHFFGRILVSYISIVFCCITGSLTLYTIREILTSGFANTFVGFIKSPGKFIKLYHMCHFEYQTYAFFQALCDVVFLFSFNQISFYAKILGFLIGRICGTLATIPVSHAWPLMPNLLENASKKYKTYGLRYFFQGAVDAVHIEIVVSITFILAFKTLHTVFPVIYS